MHAQTIWSTELLPTVRAYISRMFDSTVVIERLDCAEWRYFHIVLVHADQQLWRMLLSDVSIAVHIPHKCHVAPGNFAREHLQHFVYQMHMRSPQVFLQEPHVAMRACERIIVWVMGLGVTTQFLLTGKSLAAIITFRGEFAQHKWYGGAACRSILFLRPNVLLQDGSVHSMSLSPL